MVNYLYEQQHICIFTCISRQVLCLHNYGHALNCLSSGCANICFILSYSVQCSIRSGCIPHVTVISCNIMMSMCCGCGEKTPKNPKLKNMIT